jgi:hypothetical protein
MVEVNLGGVGYIALGKVSVVISLLKRKNDDFFIKTVSIAP